MSRHVHLFPIEPIEERYSADWHRWWPDALRRYGFEVTVYDGDQLGGQQRGEAIRRGQFLDAVDTHYYKATQLAGFCEAVENGHVHDGDVVLLLDGWNPAVTSLAYMRDVAGIKFKIVLVLHAGTWDPFDHLTQCGLWRWARKNESGWMAAADRILVATEFHHDMLMQRIDADIRDKVEVTGFPLDLAELDHYRKPWAARPMQVVFPHRLAAEKRPEDFDALREAYSQAYPEDAVTWVRTQDLLVPGEPTKPRLYHALGESRVAFSAAQQETWGIVQLEAWYLGAIPVVPDALSYRELYPDAWRYPYGNLAIAVECVHSALHRIGPVSFDPGRDPRDAWGPIYRALELA